LASVFVRPGLRRQPGGTDGRAAAAHPPATSTVASTYGIFTSRATLDAFIAQISLQLQITLIKNTHAVAAQSGNPREWKVCIASVWLQCKARGCGGGNLSILVAGTTVD